MKKLLSILAFAAMLPSAVSADFSRSRVTLHPTFPGTGPFIIEIAGTWPTDCHPGEQKPVIESFDGETVEIDFEIITVHITCNTSDTDYRVLVDMSEAVRKTKPSGNTLHIRSRFDGDTLDQTVELACPENADCNSPSGNPLWAEPGLYYTPGLANQGLLLARQNAAMAIYPLVYDENASSEWLFTGNIMVEDSFFSDLLRLSGGDCFGCDPTGAVPDIESVGHLSVLADRPGVLQVKVNDGLFREYRSLMFGYPTFQLGPAGEQTLIDLEGRWGLSENHGTNPPLGDLTEFIPGAFDIKQDKDAAIENGVPLSGELAYLVTSPGGETLGHLVCRGQTASDGTSALCEFIDPADTAEPLFLFTQQGPARLAIEYGRPVIAVGIPPGGHAVRLD